LNYKSGKKKKKKKKKVFLLFAIEKAILSVFFYEKKALEL